MTASPGPARPATRHRVRLLPVLALIAVAAACAPKAPPRPAGAPTADPTAVTAYQAATRHCRPLRTATAAIGLSGRAGGERIRARLAAGFAAPASVRIEALAPFGPPGLLLASDGAATTLLFPRDKQVLRGASVAELLDAITGLALGADELRDVLFGCLALDAATGLAFGSGWQAVEQEGTRVYLRDGAVVGADFRGWLVDYSGGPGGARSVRVRRTVEAGAIDLTAALTQVEMNTEVAAAAFVLEVPSDADVITLEQLRAASPLAPTGDR